ncbi:MAG: hypothetical protein J6W76_03855, partial [Spirochaetales bacterium]|nr:hypothetical protein [Spirochaetales bacterium]
MNKALSFSVKTILIMSVIILTMMSCIYDPNMTVTTTNPVVNVGGESSGKISTLQAVIDAAPQGASIDLSQHLDITEYDATINKSITIKNASLHNGNLSVVSDGVTLSNVHNAAVKTQSSMKISGSSLSSLNISSVSAGRGDTTSDYIIPPKVEIVGSTVNTMDVGIKNAFLHINDVKSDKITMSAKDTQLTIQDNKSEIDEISFSEVCQIVLKDGTSDKIAVPKATAAESGVEALQIIAKNDNSSDLIQLSVVSGIKEKYTTDETPDFSSMIVRGYYNNFDGVTVYKPGDINYRHTDTFTMLETDYSVKVGGVTYYENGIIKSTVKLTSGKKTVEISKGNVSYSFDIMVVAAVAEETPTEPTLNSITLKNADDIIKNVYVSGEKLNLKGLIVEGHYTYGSDEYTKIVTGWTSNPSDGDILSEETVLNVMYNGKNIDGVIMLTVVPSFTFTFVPRPDDESYNILQAVQKDHTVDEIVLTRQGYKFLGWY